MANGQRANDPEREQIGRIYSELDTVRQQQAKQDETLNHLAKGMDRLANGFDQMRQEWARHSQTDWKTLASWAAVILGIIGLGISLTIAPIRDRQADIRIEMREHREILETNRVDAARLQERSRWLEKRQDHDDEASELREIRTRLDDLLDDQKRRNDE